MRALTRGERQASAGVAAGLLGLACLLIASVGLNIKHAADLTDLHRTIYQRCIDRAHYDRLSNQARQVEIVEWRRLAQQQPGPSGIAYTRMADAMQSAVNGQVRGGCAIYR